MGRRSRSSIPSQFKRNAVAKNIFKKDSKLLSQKNTTHTRVVDISKFVEITKKHLTDHHLEINDKAFTTKESCQVPGNAILTSDFCYLSERYLRSIKFTTKKIFNNEFRRFFNITSDKESYSLISIIHIVTTFYTWIKLQLLKTDCYEGYMKPLFYTTSLNSSIVTNSFYKATGLHHQLELEIRYSTPNFEQEYELIREFLIICSESFDFRNIVKSEYASLLDKISKSCEAMHKFEDIVRNSCTLAYSTYLGKDLLDLNQNRTNEFDITIGWSNDSDITIPHTFPIDFEEFRSDCIVHPLSNHEVRDLYEKYIKYFDIKEALKLLPKSKGMLSDLCGWFLRYEVLDESKVNIKLTALSNLTAGICEVLTFDLDCNNINDILDYSTNLSELETDNYLEKLNVRASKGSLVQIWSYILRSVCSNCNKDNLIELSLDKVLSSKALPRVIDSNFFKKSGLSRYRVSGIMESILEPLGVSSGDHFHVGYPVLFFIIKSCSRTFLSWLMFLYFSEHNIVNIEFRKYKYSKSSTIPIEYHWVLTNLPDSSETNGEIPVNEYLIPLDRELNRFILNENGEHLLRILNEDKQYKISDIFKFNESPVLLFDKKNMFKYIIILIKLGKEGSPFIKVSDELYSDDFSQKIDHFSEYLSGNKLESISNDVISKLLSLISFKFKFVFDGIKMCETKDFHLIDKNTLDGLYINRLGDSLEIYEYSMIDGKMSIVSEYFMDFVDTIRFNVTDVGFVEENLYSIESDSLLKCGEIGEEIASNKLTRISETLFAYVFFSILFLEKKRIQVLADNVKNGKVTLSSNELRNISLDSKRKDYEVKDKKIKADDNSRDKEKSVQITDEELEVFENINAGQFDIVTDLNDINGIKVISLQDLFFVNLERVFKGQNTLNRLKPKYRLKSWNVSGHLRTYKSGKQVYIAPHKNNRNSELLEEDYIDYQQKIITSDDFKKSNLF